MLLIRGCEHYHRITVKVGRHGLFLLVRRHICWDEDYASQIAALLCRARQRKVSTMYGIEGTAEKADVHRLCGAGKGAEQQMTPVIVNPCRGKWAPAKSAPGPVSGFLPLSSNVHGTDRVGELASNELP